MSEFYLMFSPTILHVSACGGGLLPLICMGTSIIIKMSAGPFWLILQEDNSLNEKSFKNNSLKCSVSQSNAVKEDAGLIWNHSRSDLSHYSVDLPAREVRAMESRSLFMDTTKGIINEKQDRSCFLKRCKRLSVCFF